MKIIYLHQYFNSPSMKGGTRSYEMARRMVARGHEVHMITSYRQSDKPSSEWFYTIDEGIHIHWLAVKYNNKMSYKDRVGAFFKFALKAGRKAINIGGDIIFATSTPLTIAIPAVKAKKKLKVPMVFEVRDLWPELPIAMGAIKSPILIWMAKRLEKYAYFNAEHVIGLSPGMSEGVARTGYPKEQISTVPNSCDLDVFNPETVDGNPFRESQEWLGDRPLVIYAGTLGHINGVSYLADLAAKTYEISPEVRFLVIGAGVDDEKVRNRALELGVLNKNFFMFERVAKNEIPDVFAAATVSTSLFINLQEMWANSANKFFDALAAGKPIAINYGGWQADIFKSDQIGVILPAEPTEQAASMLVDLINDEEQLKSCGRNARRVAQRDFSRDKLAEELIAVLELVHTKNK
ncbi:MAG: glycosyltransferase family 4 protein [Idiomarina sp.]|nr:glycosyltransferase family 4 protein [Idiomarina sp.]